MSIPPTPQSLKSVELPNVEQILGLAVFDAQGLPCESFITPQHKDTEWVQLVFQSLGLQYLMAAEMELPPLDHAMIRTKVGNIVVVRSQQGYVALFLKRALPQERPSITQTWVKWICDFEKNIVRRHSNFKAV